MKYYNYWDGDYFIRHMMMAALRRDGWSFSTESGARRFQIEPFREGAIAELRSGGANATELKRFPISVEMDLFAERGNEVLAIEIKTRLFARIKAEKVATGFHHSTMHFGPPQSAIAALRHLQGNRGYDADQDEMGTICEFYRYLLALNALTQKHAEDFAAEPMKLFNQKGPHIGDRILKTAILVPFYCEVPEREHIMKSLRNLQKLVGKQGLRSFPVSLWVLTPTTGLINDADMPPGLRIDLFDKIETIAPLPPKLDPKSIHHAYELTLDRGNYRGCSRCTYRRSCLNLIAKSPDRQIKVA